MERKLAILKRVSERKIDWAEEEWDETLESISRHEENMEEFDE